MPFPVIPRLDRGIQFFQLVTNFLDPGFRRGDDFLRIYQSFALRKIGNFKLAHKLCHVNWSALEKGCFARELGLTLCVFGSLWHPQRISPHAMALIETSRKIKSANARSYE
jgi:hypothetical protein